MVYMFLRSKKPSWAEGASAKHVQFIRPPPELVGGSFRVAM